MMYSYWHLPSKDASSVCLMSLSYMNIIYRTLKKKYKYITGALKPMVSLSKQTCHILFIYSVIFLEMLLYSVLFC